MNRLNHIFLLLILLACCKTGASAQTSQTSPQSAAVLKELLAAPAPTPRTAVAAETPEPTKSERPAKFFDKENVPPDDAPIEDLQEYWNLWVGNYLRPVPSNTVCQRLLDSTKGDFAHLARFLQLIPSSDNFAEQIKQVFDRGTNDPEFESYREAYKKWLLFNSKYFLGELIAKANKVKDDAEGGYVDNDDELIALTKLDWSRAEPLLKALVDTGQPRTSTLAISLLYRHSIDEKETDSELNFRSKLQTIASNRSLPGRARGTAIDFLSESDWSGRDEWYLSLFSDESLISVRDGNYGFSPLDTLFGRDPDKWIPVMTKLVAGKDKTIQQAAASCLVRHVNFRPRRDAILPVLRWLTDPDWIPINGTERAWFMQHMDDLDVPESIPGLIWIVENDEDYRKWAARTLAYYKDARAIPALKKALAEVREDDRTMILEGLVASGGVPETEQVEAIEAYAAMRATEPGREKLDRFRTLSDERLPIPVSIGRYLSTQQNTPDSVVRGVLSRATALRKTNPAVSRALMEIAEGWQGRQVDLELVRRIAANTAEANTIIAALNRRANLRKSVEPELHSLIAASAVPKGIGAVLIEDDNTAGSILISNDQSAQIALLASARLTQTALPINLVAPLLKSKNTLLALAAERYLLAEDSKESRTILLQHHPNEAFITGWRENIEMLGGENFDQIGKHEEKLKAELLKPDGPTEILALLSNSEHYSGVLRIYPDKAVYTHYEDVSRYRERVVPVTELSIFRELASTRGLADLGPQIEQCHHNCWISEFVMLSKDGGRRLFAQAGGGGWIAVATSFQALGTGEGVTTHYNFAKNIKGLEVLYADDKLSVLDVWQRGDDIRIFVERAETEEELKSRLNGDEKEDEDDENARAQSKLREIARYNALFSWRSLKERDASSVATVPDGYPSTFDAARFPLDDGNYSPYRDERNMQVLSSDSILIARNFDGLWKQVAGTKAVRISGDDGAYAAPIVTPDGKWAVIAKTDGNWSEPNYLVRWNLETGREFRVKVEPAEDLMPIRFLPLHRKILIYSAKAGPEMLSGRPVAPGAVNFYLIDPQTGEVKPVSGEFEPLRQEGKRFLQPIGEPGQYWAAIPDQDKNQTQVGRYNLKDFSFKPVLTVPQISFDSMSMWVDEKAGKLYVVYKGQLLRLPLELKPSSPP